MINSNFWYGVVEDVNDPEKMGRVRVRFHGIHTADKVKDDKKGIPTEELPWAFVMQPTTSAAMNGIGSSPTGMVQGTWVCGFFRDRHMQAPIIIGTFGGIPEDLPDTSRGFADPDGIYPKEDYLNESDVNRLARNEKIDETIVQSKKDMVETGVTSANGVTWDEPETPYAAEYPKNTVYESESGHIEEVDDTPGAERLHTYHKSGTFKEVHPDGSVVRKIIGDDYEIVAKGKNVLVKGTCNVTVIGTCNLKANLANVEIPTTNWVGNITLEGDINQTGDITQEGDINQTGDLTSTGTIDGKTEVKAGAAGTKLTTHNHPSAPPGPPSSPTPGS